MILMVMTRKVFLLLLRSSALLSISISVVWIDWHRRGVEDGNGEGGRHEGYDEETNRDDGEEGV